MRLAALLDRLGPDGASVAPSHSASSHRSVGSAWSIGSVGSAWSIGSIGSALSTGSVGSPGSTGAARSVGDAGAVRLGRVLAAAAALTATVASALGPDRRRSGRPRRQDVRDTPPRRTPT